MDLPKSSGGCESVDEKEEINAVMVVGSESRVVLKKIEVGCFSPSSFNKGKTLEEIEIDLAIQESLEYDQRERLINGVDKENGACFSSSSCATVVKQIADVTSNPHDVDLIEVICLSVHYFFY